MDEESENPMQEVLPPVKRVSKTQVFLIVFVVASVAAALLGVIQQNSANNKWRAELRAEQDAAAAAAETAWIPDGYTTFAVNPDIAQDANADLSCAATAEATGKYCWTYQIATKNDCSKVVATLDLTNNGMTVATVTGEATDVTSSTPTFLEVDSGLANDSKVSSITKGHLVSIECN